jgi:hypothetical protein
MYLIIALLGAALGYVIVGYTIIPKVLKFKPFNCPICLSFWIGFIYSLCYYGLSPLSMFMALGVGALSLIFVLILEVKLW